MISSLIMNMLEAQIGQIAFAPAAPTRESTASWYVAATAGIFALAIVFMVVRAM